MAQLTIKVTPAERALLSDAAELCGMSLQRFCAQTVMAEVERVLRAPKKRRTRAPSKSQQVDELKQRINKASKAG